MSRLYPSAFEMRQLNYVCRYCAAAPGVWCTLPNDRWAAFLHSDRFYQLRPDQQRHAGTDFPRDPEAEIRLVRILDNASGGNV